MRLDLLASHSSCFLRFFNCDFERGLGSLEFAIVVGSVVLDSGLAGVSSVLIECSSFIVGSLELELELGAIESVEVDASSGGATLRIFEGRSSMSDIFT